MRKQIHFDVRHRPHVARYGEFRIVPAGHWTQEEGDSTPQLSYGCATYAEFENVVDSMIADLTNLKSKMKRKFARLEKSPPRPLLLD